MKIKGICKDCRYRWQHGVKGEKQHLYCNRPLHGRIIQNTNKKGCEYYEKADEDMLRAIKSRCQL